MMQFDLFSRLCSKPYSKDFYFGKYRDTEGKKKRDKKEEGTVWSLSKDLWLWMGLLLNLKVPCVPEKVLFILWMKDKEKQKGT